MAMPLDYEQAERQINDVIVEMLLSGEVQTAREAETKYLDERLEDVLELVDSPLSDAQFRDHPLIVMLMSYGSRGWEDALW